MVFQNVNDNMHSSTSCLELGGFDCLERHPPKRLLIDSLWSTLSSEITVHKKEMVI